MKKKRTAVLLLAAVFIVCLLLPGLAIAAGLIFAGIALRIPRQTLEEARNWQAAHYDISWYDTVGKEDYTVTGTDGYVLHVQHLSNPSPSGQMVILSHGYSDNRFGSLKYARLYLDLGFDVILYDLRGHGENEPALCSFSGREAEDLNVLIRDCRSRYPDTALLGLHGESLGAATSIAALKEKPEVDFVVADCGFSEISSVLLAGMQQYPAPDLLLRLVSLGAKLRTGYFVGQMRPIDSLPGNEIPILFIHGADDTFIPPKHSQNMQKATAGPSEIHLVPGAAHAASLLTDRDAYLSYVKEFLEKIQSS